MWCVERHKTNRTLPSKLKHPLKQTKGQLLTIDILRKTFRNGLPQLDADKSVRDAFLWFEPPSLSPRIVNQYAYFSLMSGVSNRHDLWLDRHPHWYWGVSVPAGLKKEVRRRLQVMNITEHIIYTGLEGIARWLRSYYSP